LLFCCFCASPQPTVATALASASAAAGREEAEDSPPSEFDLFVGAAPRRRPTQASRNQKDKIQQKGKEEVGIVKVELAS
jgi:hypothetical protein